MEKQETEKLKRTRKRTAETEIPKQLSHSAVFKSVASSVASCTDTYVFNLTLMEML